MTKKCKVCREPFTPYRPLQMVCGGICAQAYVKKQHEKDRAKAEKEQRKKDRAKREQLKTRGKLLKEAQAEFNKFIRLRDHDKPCISCGRFHNGQYHAGHYRSVGSAPELRFNEDNCHKQCSACNNHLSGNLVNYRINLIDKIGLNAVETLEGPHERVKLAREDIKQLKVTYRAMCKQLQSELDLV